MQGEILYKILNFLEDRITETFDFSDAFLSAGYGASFWKLESEHKKRKEKRVVYQQDREKRRRLQKYIYNLKKDGLIDQNSSNQFVLTKNGKDKLEFFKNQILINKNNYKKEVGDKVIIISYDIPVVFNKERNNLRDILKSLGFNLVHKSVWIGKVKLPKHFVTALEKLNILDYVEILEVTESGSLKSYN